MKEIVIISGKGGTGKTSLTASFAALAPHAVIADCDVDAPDLHLLLDPSVQSREPFSGGSIARIRREECTGCGKCAEMCRFDAIFYDKPLGADAKGTYHVDPVACEGCGLCTRVCPEGAVEFAPHVNGELMISDTRFGPMVHAKLGIAEANSGKLVTSVRSTARNVAEDNDKSMVLIDGSPGIGCPVIASITGADLIIAVTEPTRSGWHDLARALDLASHFGIPAGIVINRWDINSFEAEHISEAVGARQIPVFGRVRYDTSVTRAMVHGRTIIEEGAAAADDISTLWQQIENSLSAITGNP